MTRVLIAFDKFKDALTSREACNAAAQALRRKHPDWQLDLCPLADGGDGFCETLTHAARGRLDYVSCTGPRGLSRKAPVGYISTTALSPALRGMLNCPDDAPLAIIEMATSSGLVLLPMDQRDPWQTSSRGTGELIAAATKAGVGTILLGVGGSATNDLGLGALAALGVKFFDDAGAPVFNPVPASWDRIARLEGPVSLPALIIACDVTNPLLGPSGATATFGPQKGLQPADLPQLEHQAARLSQLLCTAFQQPHSLVSTPGAGAAGGFAFGLMVAAQARLLSGSTLVSEWLNLPGRIAAADIVLTGEGRFDLTSRSGKGPGSVVEIARRLGKKIHVFAGSLDPTAIGDDCYAHAISPTSLPLTHALPRTGEFLIRAIDSIF